MNHPRSNASIPSAQPDQRRYLIALIIGDIIAFLVFAAIGRRSHNVTATHEFLEILKTAAPFLLGWFAVSPVSRAYRLRFVSGEEPSTKTVWIAVRQTAVAWVIAWPVGLLLRALFLQRGIPLSFALVTLIANSIILCGWRAAFAWIGAWRRDH